MIGIKFVFKTILSYLWFLFDILWIYILRKNTFFIFGTRHTTYNNICGFSLINITYSLKFKENFKTIYFWSSTTSTHVKLGFLMYCILLDFWLDWSWLVNIVFAHMVLWMYVNTGYSGIWEDSLFKGFVIAICCY